MNEQQARVLADAKDWYFEVFRSNALFDTYSKTERQLGKAIENLLAAEKILPTGIKVLRDTPTEPVLNEPYVIQPTDTGWRPDAPEA